MSTELSEVKPVTLGTAIGPRRGVIRRLLSDPMAVTSLAIIGGIVLLSVLAPIIAPFSPTYVRIDLANEPPFQSEFILGGDAAGRDVLSRLLYAGGLTLVGALITVVVGSVLGVVTGLLAGYFGGVFDAIASWIANVVLVLPSKIVLVALFAVIGPNTMVTMTVLGVMVAPGFFRLVRNLVIGVKNELYVDAARVSGLSDARIIGRHVLSVVRAPIIIQAAFVAGIAVVIQAGLEFIGLGDPSTPTWGGMLQDAFLALYKSPTLLIWPGVMIGLFVSACVLLGNAIRDALEESARVKSPRRRVQTSTEAIRIVRDDVIGTRAVAREDRTALASLRDLTIAYALPEGGERVVVHGIDLDVRRGEVVGLVGESGSGKTQTALALLGLLPHGGHVIDGSIVFDGAELIGTDPKIRAALRGRRIAYVPQEPMSNLDPAFRVGFQLTEPLRHNLGLSRAEARTRALELLRQVGIVDPERVFRSYPHEISGGMAQRVLIAGAISCDPDLLIADEPTTALDVTVQAEILGILRRLQKERDMALLLVTHNFGVVADLCDRVAVMQLGRIVEEGRTEQLFDDPKHPYTQMLLGSILDDAPARPELEVDAGPMRPDAVKEATR